MLLFVVLIDCVFALPSGIYLATAEGNEYLNPVRQPHAEANLPVTFSTYSYGQAAVSTGHTVLKSASAKETYARRHYAKSASLALV